MRKIQFYVVGSLALGTLFAGCTLPEGPRNNNSPVVVVPTPVTTPSVIPTATPSIVANPGLIQSTNPNERLRQVKAGNKDPFAANQPTAIIIDNTADKPSGENQNTGNSNTNEGGNTTNSKTGRGNSSTTTPSGLSDILDEQNQNSGKKGGKRSLVVKAKSGEKGEATGKGEGTASKNGKTGTKTAAKNTRNDGKKTGKPGSSTKGKKTGNIAKNNSGSSGKPNNPNKNSPNPDVDRPSVPNIPDEQSTPPIAVNPGIPPTGNPGGEPGQPSPPETSFDSQASKVEVRGVVQLDNGYAYAIVKGPNEKSSSNLAQGDTVPNTSILVKRIEVGQAEGRMSGTVILEENGVEVSRAVGDKVAGAGESEGTSGGSVPPSGGGAPVEPNYSTPESEQPPPPPPPGQPSPAQPPTAQPVPNPPPPANVAPGQPPGVPSPNENLNSEPSPGGFSSPVNPTPISSPSPGFSSPSIVPIQSPGSTNPDGTPIETPGFPTPEGTPPLDR
jgi:hypothetical protein